MILPLAPRGPMRGRFTTALALSGPVYAIITFGEVIARKSLGASALAITLLTMLMPLANFTAIWWSRMLEGRDQRKIMLIVGLIGHIGLMTGIYLTHLPHLLLIYLIYYLAYAVVLTAQNRLLQQHVASKDHGSIFGMANSLRMAAAALVSWLAGLWMDGHPDGFRHVFFITGAIGVLSTILFASIPTRHQTDHVAWRPTPSNLLAPLKDAARLLKRRPDFLRFEIGFMIYGMAFMMMLPVTPIFLVDDLQLDYTMIGLARGAVFQLVTILSIAWFGRLYDRVTAQKLASIVFSLLALHPLLLMASYLLPEYTVAYVFASFGVFGIAMGGVSILWSVSSVRFAGEEDAGVYQAVHIAATAVRGSVAPLLGYVVMTWLGRLPALAIASAIWLVSGLFMAHLHRKDGVLLTGE
ncbi:MFS transporter [bacterium]|nr:MFS transporter [bacterium]